MTGITDETRKRVEKLIEDIHQSGKFFRGEPEHYPKISSTLYRRFEPILTPNSRVSVKMLQNNLADFAIRHVGQEDSIHTWSMMQHLGAATNLIDFTRDPKVALFFSCLNPWDKDGRVLILRKNHSYSLITGTSPQNRIRAQKSQFVWSANGYVSDTDVEQINIPQELKIPALKYLIKQKPSVSHATMYADMPGYVKHSLMYEQALLWNYDNFLPLSNEISRIEQKYQAGNLEVCDVSKIQMRMKQATQKMESLVAEYPWFSRAHWQLGQISEIAGSFNFIAA